MPYVETLMGLRGFSEEMRQVGRTPHGRTFEVVREAVRDKSLGLALTTSVGDEVIRLSGVMYIDNRPTVVFVSRIPAALGVDIDESFTGSLYWLLEDEYGLQLREANETLEGGPCPEHAAALLELPVGAPALIRRRLTYGSPRCRWSMSSACTPHQRSRSLE